MFLKVGTLKTYSSLAVFVTTKRPLSAGGRMSAPGFSTTPNGAYIPPPINAIVATCAAAIDEKRQAVFLRPGKRGCLAW